MTGAKHTAGRRRFLGGLGASTLAGGCACPSDANRRPPLRESDGPDVIVFTADDLGLGSLSFNGNPDTKTPNLDRIAAEGVNFRRAFNVASTCSTSRASLITGQYPHAHGVIGLTHRHREVEFPAERGHETLPSRLRAIGYRSAIQGKWHVSPSQDPALFGYERRLSIGRRNAKRFTSAIETVDFIRTHRSEPYYLEVNFLNTHRKPNGVLHMDPDFPVDPERISIPRSWVLPDHPDLRIELAGYYSQLSRMDALIGEVLNALDELDLTRQTIVVFLSDNGAPFPLNKKTLYDRGIGTPLLVRWPERVKPGVCDHLVSSIDIMPTLLEALDAHPPVTMQATSFLSLLDDPNGPATRQEIYGHMHYHAKPMPMRAIRTHDWKYIANFNDEPFGLAGARSSAYAKALAKEKPELGWLAPRPPEELYDLRDDPFEQRNLLAGSVRPHSADELRDRLLAHLESVADPAAEQLAELAP